MQAAGVRVRESGLGDYRREEMPCEWVGGRAVTRTDVRTDVTVDAVGACGVGLRVMCPRQLTDRRGG